MGHLQIIGGLPQSYFGRFAIGSGPASSVCKSVNTELIFTKVTDRVEGIGGVVWGKAVFSMHFFTMRVNGAMELLSSPF